MSSSRAIGAHASASSIQIDGCDHEWFEDCGPRCTALVYIDDATGRLMELRFVRSESTFDYFEATDSYLRPPRGASSARTSPSKTAKELRLRDISSRDGANAYAPTFMEYYNRRFGREPQSTHDARSPSTAPS